MSAETETGQPSAQAGSGLQERPATDLNARSGSTLRTLILCGTIFGITTVVSGLFVITTGMNSTSNALRPQVTYSTAIASTIGQLNRESKLVVLTVPVNVSIYKKSEKWWAGLPMGTTEVLMIVPDNKVQYVMTLEAISEKNFTFDEAGKKLIFRAPAPQLDMEMVDIQSNPEEIKVRTNVGWARLDRSSGEGLRKSARAELREAVLAEGNKPFLQEQARQTGELHLRQLLMPLMRSLSEDVDLQIEFE